MTEDDEHVWINITKEAQNALRKLARYRLDPTWSRERADGTVDIKLEDETLDRLHAARFPDESYSELILRIIAQRSGSGLN